jgi:hypothetical protein
VQLIKQMVDILILLVQGVEAAMCSGPAGAGFLAHAEASKLQCLASGEKM